MHASARTLLCRLIGSDRGVSAVEFSLLAPVFVIGSLSAVDAGMAIYEKMMISQVLRSGAHGAINAESEAVVMDILEATAADNFTVVQGPPGAGQLGITVTGYCICPENTGAQVACDTNCADGDPDEFYQMVAVKEFTAIMLPDFTLTGTIDVIAP